MTSDIPASITTPDIVETRPGVKAFYTSNEIYSVLKHMQK
jgi:hypothetical protein